MDADGDVGEWVLGDRGAELRGDASEQSAADVLGYAGEREPGGGWNGDGYDRGHIGGAVQQLPDGIGPDGLAGRLVGDGAGGADGAAAAGSQAARAAWAGDGVPARGWVGDDERMQWVLDDGGVLECGFGGNDCGNVYRHGDGNQREPECYGSGDAYGDGELGSPADPAGPGVPPSPPYFLVIGVSNQRVTRFCLGKVLDSGGLG